MKLIEWIEKLKQENAITMSNYLGIKNAVEMWNEFQLCEYLYRILRELHAIKRFDLIPESETVWKWLKMEELK